MKRKEIHLHLTYFPRSSGVRLRSIHDSKMSSSATVTFILLLITFFGPCKSFLPQHRPTNLVSFVSNCNGEAIRPKKKFCLGADASMSKRTIPFGTLKASFFAVGGYFVNPAICGGILSGGLHAVTGPDHLAALLPPSVGQTFLGGMKIGAVWGLGHGISATMLGLAAFFLKGRIGLKIKYLQGLSTLAESAVGISLLLIGAIGIKENIESREGDDSNGAVVAPLKSLKAIFANGFLHGFSWDGAPSVAPALAMTTWSSALSFLVAYCVGTMLAMSVTAGVVGESSLRIGKAVNSPTFTRNLSFGSSLLAIGIGIFWIAQALLH